MDSWVFYFPMPDAWRGPLIMILPCEWGGYCGPR